MKKSCQNPFLAIVRLKNNSTKKKFRWPLSSRGGGKALVARPLVDELFFEASLSKSNKILFNSFIADQYDENKAIS